MHRLGACVASALILAGSAPALAQSNLERLGQFKTTGVTDFTFVEQGGEGEVIGRAHV